MSQEEEEVQIPPVLTPEKLKLFVKGEIPDSEVFVSYALTILQVIRNPDKDPDGVIYYEPGIRTKHRDILESLPGITLEQVGLAARLSIAQYPKAPLELQPGGMSIDYYQLHNVSSVQDLLVQWLNLSEIERNVKIVS